MRRNAARGRGKRTLVARFGTAELGALLASLAQAEVARA